MSVPKSGGLGKQFVEDAPSNIEDTEFDLRRQFCDTNQRGSAYLAILGGFLIGSAVALVIVALHAVVTHIINQRSQSRQSGDANNRISRLQLEFNRVLTYIAVQKGTIKDPTEHNPSKDITKMGEKRDELVFDPAHKDARINVYLQMCAYFGMVPRKQRSTAQSWTQ